MPNRAFGHDHIERANQAYEYAQQQLELGMKQEHYNDIDYSEAQSQLEEAIINLTQVERIANRENRDEFTRLRLRLMDLQNRMIITPH